MSDDGQARFPGKLPGKGTRNGLPEFRPYRWRDPDAAREAQVKALLAGIRAQLTEEEEEKLDGSEPPGGWFRPFEREGCGTSAGYQRHIRNHEKACQACTDAHSADHNARNEARRAAGWRRVR